MCYGCAEFGQSFEVHEVGGGTTFNAQAKYIKFGNRFVELYRHALFFVLKIWFAIFLNKIVANWYDYCGESYFSQEIRFLSLYEASIQMVF